MFVVLEGKKPRHGINPNAHQQRNDKEDVVHIYNGILLSHKKNKIMPFVATWMELQIIILNEVNQTVKNVHHMILLILLLIFFSKKMIWGVSIVTQWKLIQLVSMRMWVQSLTLFIGSGIQHCPELWYRLLM